MASRTALLLGATGQTGQKLLTELLQSPDYAKVGEYGRRVTDPNSLATGKEKLIQKKIDFEKLEEVGLKDDKWDVVFITLGTTRKAAGSAQAFEKIDREYVVNAAREAKSDDPNQRLVYVSSTGADASSMFLYPRSKGLTENALAKLGYGDTIVFRPAFLAGTQRATQDFAVTAFTPIMSVVSHFTDKAQIQISTLAKSLALAGKFGTPALPASTLAEKVNVGDGVSFTLIGNVGALHLAAEAPASTK